MIRSKVTDRSQTTLPNGVRKALGLRPGEDSIEWEIQGDEAVVRRAEAKSGEDPALAPFLELLERDVAEHPERLKGMPEDLYRRLLAVTDGVEVDLDRPIEGPVAI
ncbi:MAG: type II toxin-antitoxin system PrlF family antitoxin [Longimicrobiaceae bacterium]